MLFYACILHLQPLSFLCLTKLSCLVNYCPQLHQSLGNPLQLSSCSLRFTSEYNSPQFLHGCLAQFSLICLVFDLANWATNLFENTLLRLLYSLAIWALFQWLLTLVVYGYEAIWSDFFEIFNYIDFIWDFLINRTSRWCSHLSLWLTLLNILNFFIIFHRYEPS